MKKSYVLKGIGLLASAAGLALQLLNAWVDDKKMDEKIEEKVNKALAEKESES